MRISRIGTAEGKLTGRRDWFPDGGVYQQNLIVRMEDGGTLRSAGVSERTLAGQ